MTTVQSQPLHLLVKRSAWEPRHEWESRLLFVEDNLDRFGLERAIHLSLIWANVNFLGCSYPAHTQELVSDYPIPDPDLLQTEREKREKMWRKRSGSGGGRRDRDTEPESKRTRTDQNTSSDTTYNSSADEADLPFEDISQHLEALISTIRKQHEKKSEHERGGGGGGNEIPQEVLKMIRAMCMCSLCFCVGTSRSSQLNSIIQRYVARFDKTFKHDFAFSEEQGITKCRFLINGHFITDGQDENKKVAKQKAAERFIQLVNSYYREHGKPCCPQEPTRRR